MANNTTETVSLLVVSREPSVLRYLWSVGEYNSWHLETADSGWGALERIESGAIPDVLLLELPQRDNDNLHVLRWLRRIRPQLPIILLSHHADAVTEREAVRLGAQDFVVLPFEENHLELAISKCVGQNNNPWIGFNSQDVEQLSDDTFFLSASPLMQKLRAQAELLAQSNVPVLILGEPGSGRDTTAHLIHKLSLRSKSRFLKVNCRALSGDRLEDTLFASFSREHDRPDQEKFGWCDKGTIFLDEISEMPVNLQEKLVHVIQEKQSLDSGTEAWVDVDARILAANDINIDRALMEKRLREDLYYCLSAFTIHVPPVRQRKQEIPMLLDHLMHKLARHYAFPAREISSGIVDACQQYSWPGNLRELESFVKRYLLTGGEELGVRRVNAAEPTEHTCTSAVSEIGVGNLSDKFDHSSFEIKSLKSLVHDVKSEAERNAIANALEKTGWNRKAAARLLKVSYRTMLYKIEQYHMKASDSSSSLFDQVFRMHANGWKHNGKGR